MAKWSDNDSTTYFLVSNFYLVLFIINRLNPHPDLSVCRRRLSLFYLGVLVFILDYIVSSEDISFFRAAMIMIGQIYLYINAPSVIAAEAPIPVPAPSPIPAPAA